MFNRKDSILPNVLCLLIFCSCFGQKNFAQSPDSLMNYLANEALSQTEKIIIARQEVRRAIESDDLSLLNAWLGFMEIELDSSDYMTTEYDERWLLYFWTNNFSQLFEEIGNFNNLTLQKYQYQNPPPEDGLFEVVDKFSYRNRFELYQKLRENFLSEEEQAVGALVLEFLLREDASLAAKKNRNKKVENFILKYPKSRFRAFVYDYLFDEIVPTKNVWGCDILAIYGRSDGAQGINLSALGGLDLGISYGFQRFYSVFRLRIGAQEVTRNFKMGGYDIFPDSTANVFDFGVALGYMMVENNNFRCYPTIGVGYSLLRVSETPPNPDFYPIKVKTSSPYLSPTLNFNIKLKKKTHSDIPTLAFQLGYKIQNFGKQYAELAGNQVFIGAGIRFSGNVKGKKKFD